jgi:hypothetical protein
LPVRLSEAKEQKHRIWIYINDFPVETFVHDVESLNQYLEKERKKAFSPLMQMIVEGIEIPKPCKLSAELKKFARETKERKPPKFNKEELDRMRYSITNFVDDLRQPRSKFELTATGTALYTALSEFYFRSNDLWLAKHKSIPRELKNADVAFQERFCLAFEDLFANGQSEKVIRLAEEVLKAHGGFLFDGYRNDALKNKDSKN